MDKKLIFERYKRIAKHIAGKQDALTLINALTKYPNQSQRHAIIRVACKRELRSRGFNVPRQEN